VKIHKANHPETQHACQDLHQANWAEVPNHDVILASPCCQGHSKARGKANGNPQHDISRSTAWAIVSAVEYHRPTVGVVENVREFLNWQLFKPWRMCMEAMGYSMSINLVDAADFGVPQNRERLFLVFTQSQNPIMLNLLKQAHQPARDFIDWNSGNWTPVQKKGRSTATLERISNGRSQFGDRFLAPYYGRGSGKTGRCLDRPIGTITTRDRWSVIDGDRMRMLTKYESRAAMGFSEHTVLPDSHQKAIHMLGNAVPPPAAAAVLNAVIQAI
jgi:DNA (cytosine-5)-methyltransferase 1